MSAEPVELPDEIQKAYRNIELGEEQKDLDLRYSVYAPDFIYITPIIRGQTRASLDEAKVYTSNLFRWADTIEVSTQVLQCLRKDESTIKTKIVRHKDVKSLSGTVVDETRWHEQIWKKREEKWVLVRDNLINFKGRTQVGKQTLQSIWGGSSMWQGDLVLSGQCSKCPGCHQASPLPRCGNCKKPNGEYFFFHPWGYWEGGIWHCMTPYRENWLQCFHCGFEHLIFDCQNRGCSTKLKVSYFQFLDVYGKRPSLLHSLTFSSFWKGVILDTGYFVYTFVRSKLRPEEDL